MKIMTKQEVDVVSDIRCDVCDESCSPVEGYGPQFGTLNARWGYGAHHDGEEYELHLCEACFFQTLASIQEQRRGHLMFSEQGYESNPDFGLVDHTKEII